MRLLKKTPTTARRKTPGRTTARRKSLPEGRARGSRVVSTRCFVVSPGGVGVRVRAVPAIARGTVTCHLVRVLPTRSARGEVREVARARCRCPRESPVRGGLPQGDRAAPVRVDLANSAGAIRGHSTPNGQPLRSETSNEVARKAHQMYKSRTGEKKANHATQGCKTSGARFVQHGGSY